MAAGSVSDVPLIIGTNRDEAAFFAVGVPGIATLDDRRLLGWVVRAGASPDDAAAVVAAYRSARSERGEPVTPADLWVAIATDVIFRLPSVRFANTHAASAADGVGTFSYLFTWETPAFGGRLGSCHALESPSSSGRSDTPRCSSFPAAAMKPWRFQTGCDQDGRRLPGPAILPVKWRALGRGGTPPPEPPWCSDHGRGRTVCGDRWTTLGVKSWRCSSP